MNARALSSTPAAVAALALAMLTGCTADFFVGPSEGSTSGPGSTDASDGAPESSADPDTNEPTGDDSTTSAPETNGPATDTQTTEEPPSDTSSSTGETTEGRETAEETAEDTEAPFDCITEDPELCELAFPECLWSGETCFTNLCNVGDEKACILEDPECVWERGGCVPNPCLEESECTALEPKACDMTKGCVDLFTECFSVECVPCQEVEDPKLCIELPGCEYNELREACQPL